MVLIFKSNTLALYKTQAVGKSEFTGLFSEKKVLLHKATLTLFIP